MVLRALTIARSASAKTHVRGATYIAQRELSKFSLQVIITSNGTIRRDDKELLIFGPAKSSYRPLVPLKSVSISNIIYGTRLEQANIDAPYQYSRAAVNINPRFGRLRGPIGGNLFLITV